MKNIDTDELKNKTKEATAKAKGILTKFLSNSKDFIATASDKLKYSKYGISLSEALEIIKDTDLKLLLIPSVDEHRSLVGGIYGVSHLLITIGVMSIAAIPGFIWYPLGPLLVIPAYLYMTLHWYRRETNKEDHRRPYGTTLEDLDKEKTLDSILDFLVPAVGGFLFLILMIT